uniref:NADH-ubiquinone oxidoreductase chain 2 n=1 Tax=Chaoborus sp. ZK-2019 TaxID=2527953 RepID=A0A411NHF9_9DIPT|nr:NADH dehydrogenase subunit 2 [Chaoborus sp. ZK-2019]
MLKNSSYLLFFLCLMIGTFISISANSWVSVWMGLEINLLSFIPLMNNNNMISTESSLKYFLTQALASMILLFSIISLYFFFNMNWKFFHNLIENMILLSLFLKSGTAPFHFWFPEIIEGLSWMNALIFMTWQKIAPLFLISYYMNFNILIISIIISSFIGAINGINQTSYKKLLAFSSINHIGWMLTGMLFNETLWFFYFINYCLLNIPIVLLFFNFKIFQFNQIFNNLMISPILKMLLMFNFLSLGGLPPFLGFLPKWMIMELLMKNNQYFLLWFLIMMSLITLFFYLRISISSFLLNSFSQKWLTYKFIMMKNNFTQLLFLIFSSISIFGLFSFSLIFILM